MALFQPIVFMNKHQTKLHQYYLIIFMFRILIRLIEPDFVFECINKILDFLQNVNFPTKFWFRNSPTFFYMLLQIEIASFYCIARIFLSIQVLQMHQRFKFKVLNNLQSELFIIQHLLSKDVLIKYFQEFQTQLLRLVILSVCANIETNIFSFSTSIIFIKLPIPAASLFTDTFCIQDIYSTVLQAQTLKSDFLCFKSKLKGIQLIEGKSNYNQKREFFNGILICYFIIKEKSGIFIFSTF
ncbi:hypothetical protein IMG5_167460 [Ichthyophthirius multifiliis]|uniref:Transmembrane protein n=1 Tax=Ichthyophthirius multifiliis TaxID=5932 RepID=G0R0Y1_ICHMU|nr:hypothetical protein IMG5_167460 [Ichthyophthirius multifiliis]EGR28892.1 hypothetical protein IMG5_167460 [Ichthyophthirius multifiliis]|eukprot:XP_004030128.1 hypothetical protein IMG5_167460 [Ichthyophthirius multifiliis]